MQYVSRKKSAAEYLLPQLLTVLVGDTGEGRKSQMDLLAETEVLTDISWEGLTCFPRVGIQNICWLAVDTREIHKNV